MSQIVAQTEDGETFWIRGHVSHEQAFEILVSDFGDIIPEPLTDRDLKRTYARMLPITKNGFDIELRECKKGRGAFKVTRVDL